MWDQTPELDSGRNTFRYLEISAVGLQNDTYKLECIPFNKAPSRAKMVLRAGDIVVSTTRPSRGAIARIRDEDDGAIASTGFCILRGPNLNKISRDYLLNVMLSDCVLTQMLQRSSGGAYPAITSDEIGKLLIPLPSNLNDQKRLVTELDNARAQKQEKLAKANSLLSGLNDFVLEMLGLTLPVQEDRIVYAIRTIDSINANKLYPDYFNPERTNSIHAVETKYGDDKAANLSRIADFIRDQHIVKPTEDYIGLANIQSNTGEWIESTDKDGKGLCSTYAKGDVLFARLRPYLNKVYRAEAAGVCSTEFHVIRIHRDENGKPIVIPDYLAAVLRSSIVLSQTRHMMTGNTHPRLANEDVANLVIPIPDTTIQEKIADEVIKRRSFARILREEAQKAWEDAKRNFEEQLLKSEITPRKMGGSKI